MIFYNMNFVINSKDNNVFVAVPMELENTLTNIKSLKISLKPNCSFFIETFTIDNKDLTLEQSFSIPDGSFFETKWTRIAIDAKDFIFTRPHHRSRFVNLHYATPAFGYQDTRREIKVNGERQTLIHELEKTNVSLYFLLKGLNFFGHHKYKYYIHCIGEQ